MKLKQKLEDKQFWESLKYLMNLKGNKQVDETLEVLGLNNEELTTILSFLNSVNYQIQIVDGELLPPDSKPMVNVEFSVLEWLQFQAHFPLISDYFDSLPLHTDFRNKLTELETQYSKYDLFAPLEHVSNFSLNSQKNEPCLVGEESAIYEVESEILEIVDKAIEGGKSLAVVFLNNKKIEVFPHRLVHLDGNISLISEDKADKSIVHLYLKDVERVELRGTTHAPAFSQIEIDDFISSLRAISDTEIRLILKFNKKEKVDEKPMYQHLGNPCLITNPRGDHIWAASVEPSEALMEWLYEIGPDIEILDPISFKEEFLSFCEDKLKKIA